jgi:hypothetical protein
MSDPVATLIVVPTTPPPRRSAAELNERIRALYARPEVPLGTEQREEYRRLLAELRQVERGDVTTAA